MLGYVTLGTNDFEKSKTFYDTVLAGMGMARTTTFETMQFYGTKERPLAVAVCLPYDDSRPASAGNGTMVALEASSREMVDAVYQIALAAGAPDEGEPGLRDESFYGAYFRDPDGNKICVYRFI